MPTLVPESHRDLLDGPVYAVLTTLMPDGQPQSSVVWCDYDGEHVRVNTARGRRKEKNMRDNPAVSLVAIDTSAPYRWIEVRGLVDEITEQGAKEHISTLAKLYVGASKYYGELAPADLEDRETRVICKIRPTRVIPFGE